MEGRKPTTRATSCAVTGRDRGGPTFSEGRESAPCAESQVFTCRNRRLVVEERTQPKQHYMNADVSYGRLHVAFVVAKLALTGDRSSSVGIW